jgi:hypothetical protein
MILGTTWFFQHKVTISLNPVHVCIRSVDAPPSEGVATAKIYTNTMMVEDDTLRVVQDKLLEYTEPICKVASEMVLPPLWAINHEIPLIEENKILPW